MIGESHEDKEALRMKVLELEQKVLTLQQQVRKEGREILPLP